MTLRIFALGCTRAVLILLVGCCWNDKPEQIRQKTAQETSTLKRDRQAVAAEIKDDLTERKTVDLKRASREELAALPGVDHHKADRMIAERSYAAPHPWVSWRVLSEDRYWRIEDRVTVTR